MRHLKDLCYVNEMQMLVRIGFLCVYACQCFVFALLTRTVFRVNDVPRQEGSGDTRGVETGDEASESTATTPSRWQRIQAWGGWVGENSDRFVWLYLMPVVCLGLLAMTAPSIVHAYEARFGSSGIHGTFIVTDVSCSTASTCDSHGDFADLEGGNERIGVEWGGSAKDFSVGDELAAVDTGDPQFVYPPNSGREWLRSTFYLLVAVGGLVAWAVSVYRRIRRRRASTSEPELPDEVIYKR